MECSKSSKKGGCDATRSREKWGSLCGSACGLPYLKILLREGAADPSHGGGRFSYGGRMARVYTLKEQASRLSTGVFAGRRNNEE